MQKKLIALAVAGLASTAAFAQTNVTIYGIVDAGYVASSGERSVIDVGNGTVVKGTGNANFSGIESGIMAGSRIGFKGEEALGNGLKAVFTLEYGLSVDGNVGVGSALARQQFVGLNSAKLGQVALGRQYAPGYGASARNDVLFSSGVASPAEVLRAAAGSTIAAASSARINNSVTYTSPSWSGFTVSGIYGFGEANTGITAANGNTSAADGISTGNNGLYGVGLNYANGPLNLDLLYQGRDGVTSAFAIASGIQSTSLTSSQDKIHEWMIAGSYDFKVVKLVGTYQDINNKNDYSHALIAPDTADVSSKIWSVGAQIPVFGNGKIVATYAQLSWDDADKSKSWALGYAHALSKRTSLYTTYTAVDNDSDVFNAAGGVASTRFIGEKNNTFTAGINHTF